MITRRTKKRSGAAHAKKAHANISLGRMPAKKASGRSAISRFVTSKTVRADGREAVRVAINSARDRGIAITYARDGQILREESDGTLTVLGKIHKKAAHELRKGQQFRAKRSEAT